MVYYGDNTIPCESCGTRITKKSNRTKYCDECTKKIRMEKQRKWDQNNRIREQSDI
jgi:hypothetical protein